MNPIEINRLEHIRKEYGQMIIEAAARWKHRPEVIAGIMMQETQGGLSLLLDKQGPEGRGDKGADGIRHGHGLMQIDNRWFADFIRSGDWKDPECNISKGCAILAGKRSFLTHRLQHIGFTSEEIERATIAAYNAGEGRVMKAVKAGQDPDYYTAHGNYSKSVLRYADAYLQLDDEEEESS